MIQRELKERREQAGKTLADCAEVLSCSTEGYRLKERGERPITGTELAKLADFYGLPLAAAFPSYEPTTGEKALARHLGPAA